jgi:hypothetical protein
MMRKLKYLIVGLVLLVAVTYGGLAILLVNSSFTEVSESRGFSARDALPAAEEAARAWQSDAQLVSANASWRGLPPDELLTAEVSWSYTFFSPQARTVRVWSVTPQGAAAAETITANPNTRVLDFATWKVDSPQVLTTFLDHGGRGFLEENPEATVNLRLGPSEEGESSIWLAFGLSSSNRSTLTVQVDPTSGEVRTSGS